MIGLYERRDPAVRDVIRAELRAVSVEPRWVGAARAMADPGLVAALRALVEALRACESRRPVAQVS
jgi:hypothetical protein